ncbi:MAG TPA: ribosome maturation factor RimM [Egibacteraceae bacterium]|nr:ribosome maturation factor RimM [Egibacteraceae bacterium]
MTGEASSGRALIGVVGKPVGLRGEVLVRPDPDVGDEVLKAGATVAAGPPVDGPLVIAASRLQSGRCVVRFEGVDTREAADALRGTMLTLPRSDIALDDDAVWADDVVGREVVDEAGDIVGVLESVADGTAHDYLVVARPDGGEILIPAVDELVQITPDRIIVRAIPGLLDPAE